MKIKIILTLIVLFSSTLFITSNAQSKENDGTIRLVIRGDDIGSFHSANIGCIESYKNGIMKTVEVMVPCAWYPEAVKMLNENPGLDVGIHLVLNSEWSAIKWRPLTGISSICDAKGYFFPMVWPSANFSADQAFHESDWELEDVERELRAQIELAKSEIANVSHISSHMGFTSASSSIDSLVKSLAVEYDLDINPSDFEVNRFKPKSGREFSSEERIAFFIDGLKELTPGTYLYVEHPALDTQEMETVGHIGYEDVGADRQKVTDVFTSDEVKVAIKKLGIELISYADLKR